MKRFLWLLTFLALLSAALLWLYSHKLWSGSEEQRLDSLWQEAASASPALTADSLPESADSLLLMPSQWEQTAAYPPRCAHCIAIALIGVDARLGERTPHADANHVLLIDPSTAQITIVAIPRDTPADAGFPDTSQYNKLCNVRAQRGLRAHLETLAQLVGVPEIHYYVELGFSQAFGLLRLLRFEHPSDVLRVLRARTGIWGDDYHRVYVQAQFIRQQLLHWFPASSTPWGLALLRAALGLVHTNLTVGTLMRLADSLRARGFPADSNAISIVVYGIRLPRAPVYDFTDPHTVAALAEKLRQYYRQKHATAPPDSSAPRVRELLSATLQEAEQALQRKRYAEAIRVLSPFVAQRAWWQLEDSTERTYYRSAFIELLSRCYAAAGKPRRADSLRTSLLRHEQALEEALSSPPP